MNKVYYPQNLITNSSFATLQTIYKKIGSKLYDLYAQYEVSLSLAAPSPTETARIVNQIRNEIIKFFKVISLNGEDIDPLLVLKSNYLYYNSKNNKIRQVTSDTNPIGNIFDINIESPSNASQNFSISINKLPLVGFLKDYIFYANPDLINSEYDGEKRVQDFEMFFMLSLEEHLTFLASTAKQQFSYEHYAIPKHTTKNLSYLNSQNIYYDFDSEYNYFVKKYEDLVTSITDPMITTLLPNYYSTQLYLDLDYKDKVEQVVTLNNKINVTKQTIADKEYFSDISEVIRMLPANDRQTLSKIKNYGIDSYYATEQNNTLSSENFPYAAKIKFSNYAVDALIETLEQKKLDTLAANNCHYLFTGYADNIQQITPQPQTFIIKEENIFKTPSDQGEYVGSDGVTYSLSTKNVFSSESVPKTMFDSVFNFASSSNGAGFTVYRSKDFSFFTKENLKHLGLLQNPLSVFSYIPLKAKVEELCDLSLNYQNVLNFTPLNVYPICFQVDKYSNRDVVANTITIARNATNSEISLYDTQLAYDKTYNYKIYSINLINSFKYYYNNINKIVNKGDTKILSITGTILLEKNCYIHKNLVINKNFEIFDNPPTPVDVNIVPLINSPSSLLFMLNTQSTTLLEEPKIINQREQAIFNKIRKKQNLNSKKVFFETVEDLRAVQVFRTATPPKNYNSFANNLYRTIPLVKQTSNSFIDSILQNTKYYYTFRSVDIHGNISNPTEVFEVQIINNNGAIYPIIKTYQMNDDVKNYTFNKSFKKYLSINPSVLFTELNTMEDGEVKVGSAQGVWSQKYKLRIKSKNSGKVFDINLTFNKNIQNLIDKTSTFKSKNNSNINIETPSVQDIIENFSSFATSGLSLLDD